MRQVEEILPSENGSVRGEGGGEGARQIASVGVVVGRTNGGKTAARSFDRQGREMPQQMIEASVTERDPRI
jgi:hypothetical protein